MVPKLETVWRTYDPVQADLASELLAARGVRFNRLGTQNASLIGAGTSIFEQRFEVDHQDRELALDALAPLLAAHDDAKTVAPTEGNTSLSRMRNVAATLTRMYFLGIAGALLSFLLLPVRQWAVRAELQQMHLLPKIYLPFLCGVAGVLVALLPRGARVHGAFLALTAGFVLAAFALD